MNERFVDIGDVALAVIEAGHGGTPLLLVHGFTGCKEDFVDEIDRLAVLGHWVVAPDLRGHGTSSAPTTVESYSLESFVSDMWGLVDAIGWSRFDLLGHSMGGMIVQMMILERPERVHRLVLMDTHHGAVGGVDPDLVELGIEVALTQGLEVIQQVLKLADDPEKSKAYHRTVAERPGYAEFCDAKMLRCSPQMYAAMLPGLIGCPDRLTELEGVDAPTLVLVGEWDESFVKASGRIAQAIPTARLEIIAEAGHCPQFEAQAQWRVAVDGFFAASPS